MSLEKTLQESKDYCTYELDLSNFPDDIVKEYYKHILEGVYLVARELGNPDLPNKFHDLLVKAHMHTITTGLRGYLESIQANGQQLQPWEVKVIEEVEKRHNDWIKGKDFGRHFLDDYTEFYMKIKVKMK